MRWSGRGNSLMSRKAACKMWIPCQQQAYLTVGQVSRWRPFHSRESPTPTLMAPPNAISLPLLPQRCPLATQGTQSLSALLEVWALLLAWSQRRSYKFCLPIPQCCAICPFHSCFPCWQTQLQSQRQHLQQPQLCEMHQAALQPQFWVALSSHTAMPCLVYLQQSVRTVQNDTSALLLLSSVLPLPASPALFNAHIVICLLAASICFVFISYIKGLSKTEDP